MFCLNDADVNKLSRVGSSSDSDKKKMNQMCGTVKEKISTG